MNNYLLIVLMGLVRQGFSISLFHFDTRKTAMDFEFVPRDGWHARKAVSTLAMENPVPYVIIHHTYIPPACNTTDQCVVSMQSMQNSHIDENGWFDIGYSFAVGGDGKVYEGRGWSLVGAHAPSYNDKSIGIAVIGDWTHEMPPEDQLETVHKLIQYGVNLGMIESNYTLYGHRQVRKGTECPGETLFEEIQNWPHFSFDVPFVYHVTRTTTNIER